jgi:hypothetical protein
MRAMARVPRFSDRVFDARPDRLDLRDLPYRPPLRSLPARFPGDAGVRANIAAYVRDDVILDQGTEGACTGFGLACVVNYLFWTRHRAAASKAPFDRVSARMLYELAKRYDEWRGEDYEGSSCRGALKGWHKHGVCAETLWPYSLDPDGKPVFERPLEGWDSDAATRPLGVYYRVEKASVVDLQAAIADVGAVFVSAGAHDGWDALMKSAAGPVPQEHAALPVIGAAKRGERGGHAFALVGYDERGFLVQNSWGKRWGASGFAVLPYDDWVENATDAWACALGVAVQLPERAGRMRPVVTSRWRVGSGRSLTTIARAARDSANLADDPWPIDRAFEFEPYRPWSTHEAYATTLVAGNDGRLAVADFTRATGDVEGHAQDIVVEVPREFAKRLGRPRLKLAIYAHGGLNGEEESIRRARVLAPCFAANGIHPLFLAWKTGLGDTLGNVVEDCARRILGMEPGKAAGVLDALGDAKDRAVEALAHVLAKGLWTEMRENAEFGKLPGRLLDVLARKLAVLDEALRTDGKRLELHFIGHSAGSILLGHLLERMGAGAARVKTCTLFAPACSVSFAVRYYLPAADAGLIDLAKLWIHHLSDANEKRDGLPSPQVPAYGKSLLYLVARALDDVRKMPLLGLERALDPAYASDGEQWAESELAYLKQWQKRWKGAALAVPVDLPDLRTTRMGGRTQATHGAFDNSIDAITAALERVRGAKLVAPLEWLDFD